MFKQRPVSRNRRGHRTINGVDFVQCSSIRSRVTLARIEAAEICAITSPPMTATERIDNWGHRLPSIFATVGVTDSPSTARFIASMVAWRMLIADFSTVASHAIASARSMIFWSTPRFWRSALRVVKSANFRFHDRRSPPPQPQDPPAGHGHFVHAANDVGRRSIIEVERRLHRSPPHPSRRSRHYRGLLVSSTCAGLRSTLSRVLTQRVVHFRDFRQCRAVRIVVQLFRVASAALVAKCWRISGTTAGQNVRKPTYGNNPAAA